MTYKSLALNVLGVVVPKAYSHIVELVLREKMLRPNRESIRQPAHRQLRGWLLAGLLRHVLRGSLFETIKLVNFRGKKM